MILSDVMKCLSHRAYNLDRFFGTLELGMSGVSIGYEISLKEGEHLQDLGVDMWII
jgi:hypothetical protein